MTAKAEQTACAGLSANSKAAAEMADREPDMGSEAEVGSDMDSGPAVKSERKSHRKGHPLSYLVRLSMIAFDAFLGGVAMLYVIRWRYDFLNKPIPTEIDWQASIVMMVSVVLIWIAMRQDRAIWRFTSLKDFRQLLIGVVLACAVVPLVLFFFFDRGEHFPRSAPFAGGLFFFGMLMMSRLIAMIVQNGDIRALFRGQSQFANDAILIGPSSKLYNYLRDMSRRDYVGAVNPVGLIETSGVNVGRSIRSIPVLGSVADLPQIYERLASRRDKPLQLISIDPHLSRPDTEILVKTAAELGAPLARLQSEGVNTGLTTFEAADLIGRDVQALDISPVRRLIKNRRVLVTGAGGSIGGEISAQLAALNPASLALYDCSEYNLYQLEKRLIPHRPLSRDPDWTTYIGDVCDTGRLNEVFEWERPEIVIHAAALKHVPLGETNPLETLRTNVFGTKKVIETCIKHGTENFILISTDKAVNPINIMGASKRIVEMLMVAMAAREPKLNTSAVRFGNVLASTGSVVPLFEEQIAAGGPVTVTHREVCRYFMTTSEAAALVLQAAALEEPGQRKKHEAQADIYVLEMGDPVNIAQLAKQLIRLRGKVPDKDIEIRYTGLRSGEKLSELLTGSTENLEPTTVNGIQRFTGEVADVEDVMAQINKLLRAIDKRDRKAVLKCLKILLPEFEPNGALVAKSGSAI
jgi:O-antigen biosynthesis protein WbqV